jgi:aromatic O-demethylase, cytochrome P450 subunit
MRAAGWPADTWPMSEQWLDEISVDQLENDPYPVFEQLRREAPIAWVPSVQANIASSWRECWEIASDFDNFGGTTDPANEHVFGQPNILSVDGDLHAGLRAMIDPQLRPRAVRQYIEDLARPIVREVVAGLPETGPTELMAEYFEPISVRALGDLLGFKEIDSDTLRHWFHDLSTGFANKALHPEGFAVSDAVSQEIRAVVDPKLARLSRERDDSSLSHWLHDGMPEGQTRPPEYIYPTLFVILLGGQQEPGHGAGSTLLGLLSNPDQLRRVGRDRSLIPRAINEGLRWCAPIWTTLGRSPYHDVERAGTKIAAGSHILLAYGSANRDETEFERPDVFDIDRAQHPHMAFGTGKHACAGSSFAPNLMRIALEELLEAYPSIELDPGQESPMWGWIFRGPRELHVRLTPRG